MTDEEKDYIDSLNVEQLLRAQRNEPVGSPLFEGEKGEYRIKYRSRTR